MNIFQEKIDEVKNGGTTFYSLTDVSGYKKIAENTILQEGWGTNEDVYSIVSRVASLVSSLPIVLMNGDEIVADTDPMFKKFYDNWNAKRGLIAELDKFTINYLLFGRSYIYKESPVGMPYNASLWTMPTSFIQPYGKYDFFGEPDYYQFSNGGKTIKLLPDELIITDNISIEKDIYSSYQSPLQAVWNTVKAGNNRATAEGAMFENRGIAGFISPKASSGDKGLIGFFEQTLKDVRAAFANLTGGAKKFNKVEVIQQGADFTQLGLSSSDLQLVESRINHIRSICNTYNVPSLLFNDPTSRTHANYKEAMRSMYTDAILPIFNKFKGTFEKHYLNEVNSAMGKNYWLNIDKSQIEVLNRTVVDVFASLPQGLASKVIENLTEEEVRALMLELGIIKQ